MHGQALRSAGNGSLPRTSLLRTDSNLVLINASVVDRDGHFVSGLAADRFALWDEKERVAIREFGVEEVPLSTLILLDTSKSMKKSIGYLRAGLRKFLEASLPGDDFCLIAFRGEVSGKCAFTSDVEAILREAASAIPEGKTALVDAIAFGVSEIKKGKNARKALLILSDGVETASRFKWSEVEEHAKEMNACVYAVVPAAWDEFDVRSVAQLAVVAELTGGRIFELKHTRDYPDFLEKLDVRKQYIIGFTPAMPERTGKYRRVNLKFADAKSKKLKIYWRRGYYQPVGID